jgi:nucleoside triphosphate pyrophosphatase
MPLWLSPDPLILASRSKVRQRLLAAAGIPIDVSPADLDERELEALSPSQQPATVATFLASEKALSVELSNPGRLVLGADQLLALDGRRFSKPGDRASARVQLLALSGRTHTLYSAIAFVQNASVLFEHVSMARMTMRALSDRFLEHYLDVVGDAATESVGAYQLEGIGIQLFERVEGEYFTVLGLPLMEVLDFLRQQGYLLP